jgi:DNA-binding beta-propeller fold protein YncE
MQENARIYAIGIVMSLAVLACSPFDGKLPPEDEFYFPTELKLHPGGDYLYVLSSNFDSEYRVDLGGTVTVVDLRSQRILEDATICVPSFGGNLLLSNTAWENGDPRYLFGATRGNDGVFSLKIDESDPTRLTCQARTSEISNTCVRDIEDLPDVDGSQRELPCSVYNIVDDPFALAMVPNDGERLETLDPVAVAGLRDNNLRVINFLNGEIRGESGEGRLDRQSHVTEDVGVTSGPSTFGFHPVTHDMYTAPRFSTVFSLSRFLFRDEPAEDDSDKLAGFVASSAVTGVARITNSNSNAEVRALAFNEEGTRLYASQQSPDAIIVMDISLDEEGEAINQVINRIPMPGNPSDIILHERGGRNFLYVSLFDEREIAIVDLEEESIVRRLKVGESPYAIELDEERQQLYVALFTDNSVGVVDVDPGSPNYGQLISTIR